MAGTSRDRGGVGRGDGRAAVPGPRAAMCEEREAGSGCEAESERRLPDEPAAVEVLAAKPVREDVEPRVVEKPIEEQISKPRRRFFGGLRAEVAEIKLPAAIPATIVAAPRRDGKAAKTIEGPFGPMALAFEERLLDTPRTQA